MKTVNMKRDELLKTVQANREKHANAYTEAVGDYKNAVRKMIQKHSGIVDGAGFSHIAGFEDAQNDIASPRVPRSFLKDYDRVIEMLKVSVDDTITLDAQEFSQYVQDEWHWKRDFAASTAMLKAY